MAKPYFLIIKEVAELSNKYHYWKVHLLGDLSVNSRTREMMIDVWVVPLKQPEIYEKQTSRHRLINNYYFDFSKSESRCVKIGVGQLPVLLHGTILFDGLPARLVGQSDAAGIFTKIQPGNCNLNWYQLGELYTFYFIRHFHIKDLIGDYPFCLAHISRLEISQT